MSTLSPSPRFCTLAKSFQAALQKADPEEVTAAETVIRLRLHALIGAPGHQERRAIENALDALRLLRRENSPWIHSRCI